MIPFVPVSLRAAVPILLIGFAAFMITFTLFHSVPKVEREMEDKAHRLASNTLSHLRGTLEYLYRRGDTDRARREVADTGSNPEHKIVLVLDANDSIIASTRPAWLGRPIAEIDAPYDAAAAREARKGRHGQVILAPDRRSFLGYARVRLGAERDAPRPSATGLLFIQRDVSRAKAAARRHVLDQTMYSPLFIGTLAVLFWLASHFIVGRRLARLLEAADKLAGGDLTARSGLTGGDELGRVGRAFDNVARQIADAQARLVQNEERSRDMAEVASDWLWEMDENLRFSYFSERFGPVTGVDPVHVLGKTRAEAGKGDTGDKKWRDHLADLEAHRPFRDFRYEFYAPDGRTLHLRISGRPVFDADGVFRGYRGVGTDITSRRRAEEALRASEERFRGAIESLHEGFALYDAEDRLVICNAVYRHLHSGIEELLVPGARFGDLLNASVERGLLAGAAGREEEFIRERLEQHRNPKGSVERKLTDGRWFVITEGRTPDGGTYAALRDITMLKRREAALRESEALFRAVVNHSPAKIHIKDAQGRYTLINREAEKLFGVTDEEGRGKTSHEIFSRELADSFAAHDQAVLESGQIVEVEEEWQREGGLRTYLTVKFPIRDAAGEIVAVGAIGTDITESKRAQEARERLALAIDGLAEHVVLFDSDDRIVLANAAWRELNKDIIETTVPGTRFEDHLRAGIKAGLFPEAVGREEEWLGWRMEHHRNPKGAFEVERQDRRWILINEQRLPDGGTILIVSDITERKRAEEALRASEERFRGAIESLHEGFALYDAEDRLVICNAVYRHLHSGIEELLVPGARFGDLLNASVERGLLAGAAGREEEFIRERLEQHRNPKGSVERKLTDGRWFVITEGRTPDGGTYAALRDITMLKRREAALRESEALFRAVVNHSPAKIHIKDAQGRYTLINREAEKLFGVTDEEGRGKTSHEIFSRELADSFAAHDQAVLESGQIVEVEEEWQREGGLRTYLTVKFPIRDAAGEIVAVGAIGTDITESKKAEERIRHLATHDVLTGLPNRALGMDRLSQALAMARRNVAMTALVFVDLDGFKGINDTHGHEAGDRVLKEVAGRLSSCVRETDTVARFGGDEFLLVLTAITDKSTVTAVVEKVLDSLSRSFAVDGRVTPLGASIGVALYPGDGETPEELFRRADRAMYAAKAAGKNSYRFATREQATTSARA